MKIKHIWSVLCQDSTLNQDDNVISLNKVLEALSIDLTPFKTSIGKPLPEKINLPLNYEIVSFWLKDKIEELAKGEIEYMLISPEKKELMKVAQKIEIPVSTKRLRSRMKIAGISLTKAGDYMLQVRIKEDGANAFRLVAELPLEVKISLRNASPNPSIKN